MNLRTILQCLVALFVALTFFVARDNTKRFTLAKVSHAARETMEFQTTGNNNESALSLRLGDLPGYTGWPRPATTTAAWYNVVLPQTPATVGEPYNLDIVCTRKECFPLHAIFYIRAYGPTLLTGSVTRHGPVQENDNSTKATQYEASFTFFVPGTYVVELVLSFSHVPRIESFPRENEPLYEGYLLPQTPLIVSVAGKETQPKTNSKICGFEDLYEKSPTSSLDREFWSVAARVPSSGSYPHPARTDNETSFLQYKHGDNSLGIRMQYNHTSCQLPLLQDLAQSLLQMEDLTNFYIVFIGDSNFWKQYSIFHNLFRHKIRSIFFKVNDGLHVRLAQIEKGLSELSRGAKKEDRFFVLFNAGLHEITRLCSSRFIDSRQAAFPVSDESFSCVEESRKNMETLVQMINDFRFELRVFQTTTAAWLKYGNYGFGFEPTRFQEYPLDPHASREFNIHIAWNLMRKYDIPIMDAYWLTLSRPDHREIDVENNRGKKMAHAGVEVYDVLARKWLLLLIVTVTSNKTKTNSH